MHALQNDFVVRFRIAERRHQFRVAPRILASRTPSRCSDGHSTMRTPERDRAASLRWLRFGLGGKSRVVQLFLENVGVATQQKQVEPVLPSGIALILRITDMTPELTPAASILLFTSLMMPRAAFCSSRAFQLSAKNFLITSANAS
jgi:hypothetical protein